MVNGSIVLSYIYLKNSYIIYYNCKNIFSNCLINIHVTLCCQNLSHMHNVSLVVSSKNRLPQTNPTPKKHRERSNTSPMIVPLAQLHTTIEWVLVWAFYRGTASSFYSGTMVEDSNTWMITRQNLGPLLKVDHF